MKADTLAIHGGFEGDTNNGAMARTMAAIALCILGILGCNGGSGKTGQHSNRPPGTCFFWMAIAAQCVTLSRQ